LTDERRELAGGSASASSFEGVSMQSQSIVIVGGGFAGTALAQALDGRLPAGFDLVLVSEESYTTFHPMLPEALGGSVFPEQVVAPIRAMLVRARFVMGRVTAIDPLRRTLACATLAGDIMLPYAQLVLAFGSRARLDLLPGLAEHALPLKTVGDAMHIRNVVLRRLARIELEQDAGVRGRLGRFIVLGGGFSGVECAGELADCLRGIRRYYPRVRDGELSITLLHDLPQLLPELPERLGAAAQRSLTDRGVDVRTGVRAARVCDAGVWLADGGFVEGATVVCTVGTQPNALAARASLPLERGRIVVDADLAVHGTPGVWAIGDCAHARNARDASIVPPTAQFAVAQARTLARNLLAMLAGRPTRGFAHRSRGAMAALGHRRGVASVMGIPLTGFAAWLVWRAYYLSRMPTLGRKVRILVEWTWGMFFPNDITHLRFTRSIDLESNDRDELPQSSTPGSEPRVASVL
jgi:NADH dehydrogenase